MIRGNHTTVIRDLLNWFGKSPEIGVETGTFQCATTAAMRSLLHETYTIELSLHYFRHACKRFADHDDVYCLYGDSGEIVPHLARSIEQPVFWYLDAHYPFDWSEAKRLHLPDHRPCPLFHELHAIRQRPYRDIVAVDDVSGFGTREYWKDITPQVLRDVTGASRSLIVHDAYLLEMPPCARE
jgi:hypothetical protein